MILFAVKLKKLYITLKEKCLPDDIDVSLYMDEDRKWVIGEG